MLQSYKYWLYFLSMIYFAHIRKNGNYICNIFSIIIHLNAGNMKPSVFLFFSFLLFSCSGKKKVVIKSDEDFYYSWPKQYEKVFGHVKSIVESNYDADSQMNSLNYKTWFQYDATGNEIGIASFYPEGGLHWMACSYYHNGKLNETDYYNSDTVLRMKITYTYDPKGNLIQSDEEHDQAISKSIYKNDNSGYLSEILHYDPNDSLEYHLIFKRDNNGNIIEDISEGIVHSDNIRKYDSIGNQIERLYVKSDGSLGSTGQIQYKDFDREGNWSTGITLIHNKPSSITKREIKYYR